VFKILVVEDDIELNQTICEYLEMMGYRVESVFDGEKALNKEYEENFDLILLDVKLPKINGFEVAKQIKTPVIFLTSLDGEKDVEKGFRSGADDYVKKPFSLKELDFRIKAVLRRVYGDEKIKFGEFTFDGELYKNGKLIHLKPKTIKLLDILVKNRGKIVSKEQIFDYVYGMKEYNENSLRVFMSELRHTIGKEWIETIKDRGYRFVG